MSVRPALFVLALQISAALAADEAGFPQGLWKLNERESRTLAPKSQTLEIINDDGRSLSFAINESRADGTQVRLKWSGTYGGPPRQVEGDRLTLQVRHGPQGSIRISGRGSGEIRFEEICRVSRGGNRLECNGTQTDRSGRQDHYLETYDRIS